MRAAIASMIFFAPLVAHAEGHCDSRADCPATLNGQLHCVQNTCVSDIDSVAAKENEQTRGYFGVTLGAAVPSIWGAVGEGAQLAFRLGVFTGPIQAQLEVSPATVLAGLSSQAIGMFEASGSIAVLPRISDMVYWLFRLGGGGGAAYNVPLSAGGTGAVAFGELRFDLCGVVIRPSRHVFVELDVPSFRIMFFSERLDYPLRDNALYTWVTSFTLGYVF